MNSPFPLKAPLVPPSQKARRKTEAHVKQALRDAGKVESNRHQKRFATSNSKADKIRESALAKAKEGRARAPPQHTARPTPQIIDDDDRSAYPAPLNIQKKTPQPPHQQHQRQRSVRRTELGNTVPAFRNAAKEVGQSHIHPALRTAARPADQVHPALRNTAWPSGEIHPALRNLPRTPSPRRSVSDLSQSSIERDICSYLGYPINYADSPRESDVSPVNVTRKLPYASSRKRR
ncbi:hypothetical protein INS49_008638 [Diaporthe citri]|uniref:uncharacterized protein n=1 Tax=Diaporthe citri TaxID=83186 RepID=UPI001C7E9BC8|nr:uncharacterized protein INS49_008638 [Diaporthe citri]KAG6363537.1 hypothetical protein INS49_008638 [Diaporthe citri]